MAKSNLRLVPPITENRAVGGTQPPRRPPEAAELREREHLKDAEVERLIEARARQSPPATETPKAAVLPMDEPPSKWNPNDPSSKRSASGPAKPTDRKT